MKKWKNTESAQLCGDMTNAKDPWAPQIYSPGPDMTAVRILYTIFIVPARLAVSATAYFTANKDNRNIRM